MRLRARARLLRMRLTRHWREQWRPAIDLGTISREKMYEIEARIRANVVRDRRGNEWPARNALCLLLVLLASSASAGESGRFRAYKQWAKHYQHEMGLDDVRLTFVHYPHPDWCAWVRPAGDGSVLVGLSEPDWSCTHRLPRELALHEMCHLRLHHIVIAGQPAVHLDADEKKDDEKKHDEVRKCISDYWRDRE